MATILIVDDDEGVRFTIEELLTDEGHEVMGLDDAVGAVEQLDGVDVVVTDLSMPEMDGFELLAAIRKRRPAIPVILITAYGSERVAVQAIKAGAYDYVSKPFDNDDLLQCVGRAVDLTAMRRENRRLVAERALGRRFIAESPAMQRLLRAIDRVAARDVTILLRGETGTGKEMLASLIHAGSSRSEGPLVRFNCAAIPAELAESELFGHTKGAFTGASAARTGYIAKAHRGTLVLDEIGELPLEIQAKLLRAVQQGEVQRVGSSDVEQVDLRIVASTNRDLKAEAEAGRFRSDLYYRLAVVELVVPPLRDRREDIAPLAREMAKVYAERFGLESGELPDDHVERLEHHDWPGNVRELENTIARLAALSETSLHDADLAIAFADSESGDPLPAVGLRAELAAHERKVLERALERADGNISEAARQLKVARATLFDKLQKHDLLPRND